MAKRLKEGCERRATEASVPGQGLYADMGAVLEVLREAKEVWKESDDELYYDAISGEVMIKELIVEARQVEMDTFKKYGVYEKRPIQECWDKTGKAPIGVKWVDTNKGDVLNPEYRCRLVAKGQA